MTMRLPLGPLAGAAAGRRRGPGRTGAVPGAVTPLGRTAAGVAALSLAAFPCCGWDGMLVAGVMAATMLLLALAMAALPMPVSVSVDVGGGRVVAGDRLAVVLSVRGRMPVPATGSLPVGDDVLPVSLPPLSDGEPLRLRLQPRLVHRGLTSVGPLTLERGDPLGLVRRRRVASRRCTVLVRPRTVLPVRDPVSTPDDVCCADRTDPSDGDDFLGLRRHEPGDDMRRLHWPSLARTGIPMTRVVGSPQGDDMLLALDTSRRRYASDDEFELAVSAFASMGLLCLARGGRVTMWTDGRPGRPRTADALLDACCSIVPSDTDRSPSGCRLRSPSDAAYSVLVVGSAYDAALLSPAPDLLLRARAGARRRVRRCGGMAVADLGCLDDLRPVAESLP